MAKGNNNLSGRRSSSHNSKPYDANNSFVKKVATKVTDLIPQRSWISKWFNSSQGNEDTLDITENTEEIELEEDIQEPPPLKRPRIRMDVTHPPGTFSIQTRVKNSLNHADASKQQHSVHTDTNEDFSEPVVAGPSGVGHLISSTPTTQMDIMDIIPPRSELNLLVSTANNAAINGTDDNSESSESTSGCSSLIPQTNRQEARTNISYTSPFSSRKKYVADKCSFANHLQSSRSLFLDSNFRDTLSSRRPCFNASAMTNTLERASPLSSPFYSGNITFGGANAATLYKRSRNLFSNSNELKLRVPKRMSIEVKPSNAAGVDSSGISQTAKKILEALEHFSSPIADAKKIPLKSTGNILSTTGKKRTRDEAMSPIARVGLRHLTRGLIVPTVPDILKLRRRQKLQDTTVAARKIVSAHNEPLALLQDYHLRTKNDEFSKHRGKLKAKSKAKLDQEETIEAVNLPNIPLPISSPPSFNFSPPHSGNQVERISTNSKETFTFATPIRVAGVAKNLRSINNFTFSSPISAEKSLNGYNATQTFLKVTSAECTLPASSCTSALTQNFIWSGVSTGPKLKEKTNGKCFVGSYELKSGSVIDVLSSISDKDKTNISSKATLLSESVKPFTEKQIDVTILKASVKGRASEIIENQMTTPLSVWECSECLIKNSNSDAQCIACKACKPNDENKTAESIPSNDRESKNIIINDCFGSQFKLLNHQWECTSCYVRNKQSEITCAACNAVKPNTKESAESKTIRFRNSGSMNEFKPAEASWECPGCMLRNAATITTCSCCSASRPTSPLTSPKKSRNLIAKANTSSEQKNSTSITVLQASTSETSDALIKLKERNDSWECPCCMVRNSASVNFCPCCNTANPNAKEHSAKKAVLLHKNSFGDKFKIPEGAWTCDSCMIQNKSDSRQCIACEAFKPGVKKTDNVLGDTANHTQFTFGIPSNVGGFKFGIDKADLQTSDSTLSVNGGKLGETQSFCQTTQFTFGVQKEEKKNDTMKSDAVACTNSNAEKSPIAEDAKKEEKKSITSAFSFGVTKSGDMTMSDEKTGVTAPPCASPNASSFTFGVPKAEIKHPKKHTSSPGSTANEISKTNVMSAGSAVLTNTSTTSGLQSNVQEQKITSAFSFGVPISTPAVVSNTVTSTAVAILPSAVQSSFAIPESRTTTKTTTISNFDQISPATTTSSLSTTTFTFDENKVTDSASSTLNKNSVPVLSDSSGKSIFSNISNPASLFAGADAKSMSTFGAEDNKAPAFSTTENKSTSFSMPERKIPGFGGTGEPSLFISSETKLPVFGSTNKSTAIFSSTPQVATGATSSFGSSPAVRPFFESSTAPVFAGNFGTGSTASIFSTTKPNEATTPNSSLFTFGATPSTPAAQPGTGFNFSTNTNAAGTTQKPLFTFGTNPNQTQSNSMFGGASFNAPLPSTSNLIFNAPKAETPAFGQATVATPIFGSQNSSQNQSASTFTAPASNTGFNFGSTTAITSSGGFNFGTITPAAGPSEGFNFNPPSNTPAFDPNTRPSFNFTGGSPPRTFNATPQPSSAPRRFKVAVRRKR